MHGIFLILDPNILDTCELSEQTKKETEKARKAIKQGKWKAYEQVRKELGL